MPVANDSPPRLSSPRWPSWLGGIIVGLFAGLVICGAAVWMFTGIGFLHWISSLRGDRTHFGVDQPTVVRQIQQLQRLETVRYTMDKIISGERDNPYWPKFLVGDRLLLVVHGEVIAGVDLTRLQASDVTVHDHDVSIHLPRAEVFTTRIDNGMTRVYSRDTGLFSSPDPNLESEVRQEAERQLLQAALQDGIMQSANQNASNTVSTLLKGFGFTSVETR